MGQCNVKISARQSGVVPSLGDHRATQISRTPRGLELIKSCAKFYANGVAAAKPTVALSHPTVPALNQFATSPPGVAKVSLSTVAVIFSFFLVLPSLALAAIVWWGATSSADKGPQEAAGYASASPALAAIQSLRPPRNQEATGLPAVSNAQSDIVIHKVKTQPIAAGTWEGPAGDGRPQAENSATD
jgi:hypothetical protein